MFYVRIAVICLACWVLGAELYPSHPLYFWAVSSLLAIAIGSTLWHHIQRETETKRINQLSNLVLGWFHAIPIQHTVDLIDSLKEIDTMKTVAELDAHLSSNIGVTCGFEISQVIAETLADRREYERGPVFLIKTDHQYRYIDQIRDALHTLGFATSIQYEGDSDLFPSVYAFKPQSRFVAGEQVLVDSEVLTSIANFVRMDEGWVHVEFYDRSHGTLRPSHVHAIDQMAVERVDEALQRELASNPNPSDPAIERLTRVKREVNALFSGGEINTNARLIDVADA